MCGYLPIWHASLDGRELAVNFRSAAEKFRLIEDEDSAPIIVRYLGSDGQDDSIDKWLATLRKEGPQRWLMRKLQRYTVNLHRLQAMQLLGQGDIEEIMPGLFVQLSDWLYDVQIGLLPEGKPMQAGLLIT